MCVMSVSKWCTLPSCRDWHRVLTRVLGWMSLFLVFGVWTGVFPSWRTEQQLVTDTLTYTHASKSESLRTPACGRGHTLPPPLCLCLCPSLCPPPAFILSSIIYDWGTLSRSTTPLHQMSALTCEWLPRLCPHVSVGPTLLLDSVWFLFEKGRGQL